jgi:hypothetical protein
MARNFQSTITIVSSTGITTPLPTAFPITMVGWANPNTSNNGVICGLSSDTTSSNYLLLMTNNNAGTPRFRIAQRNSGESELAIVGSNISTGTWYHAAAVFRSSTDRELYRNGVSDATEAVTTSSFPSLTTMNLSCGAWDDNSSVGGHTDSYVGGCAVWNAELTVSEIKSLAGGASPLRIRPDQLLMYVPLLGVSPEIDFSKYGNSFSVVGSPGVIDNPPMGRDILSPTKSTTGQQFNACILDKVLLD